MDRIQLPITTASGKPAQAPDHFKLADALQLALNQLGDGLFPFKGSMVISGASRLIKDLNGEVIPGVGMKVLVRDFIGLADGVVLGDKNKEQFDPTTTSELTISGSGEKYVVMQAKRIVGTDGLNRPDFSVGVLSIVTSAPAVDSGIILLSKLTIPQGATQITAAMIDNSVKQYLTNVDQVIAKNAQQDSSIAGLQTQVTDLQAQVQILGGQVGTINGDISTFDSRVTTLENKVDSLSDSVPLIQGDVTALQEYVAALQSQLDVACASLNGLAINVSMLNANNILQDASLSDIEDAIGAVTVEISAINTAIESLSGSVNLLLAGQTLTTNQISALQALVDALDSSVGDIQDELDALQTTVNGILANGLNSLSLSVQGNLAILDYKITSHMSGSANAMFNGFTDAFNDLNGLDLAQCSNYTLTGAGITAMPQPGTPTSGLVARWSCDNTLVDSVGGLYLNNGNPMVFDTGKFGQGVRNYATGSGGAIAGCLNLVYQAKGTYSCWVNFPSSLPAGSAKINFEPSFNPNGSTLGYYWSFAWHATGGDVWSYCGAYDANGFHYIGNPPGSGAYAFHKDGWHHIALSYDSTLIVGQVALKMYVDGVLFTQGSIGTFCTPAYWPSKGYNGWNTISTTGNLGYLLADEIAYYGRVLSDQEVATSAGTGAGSPGVVISKAFAASSVPTAALPISFTMSGVGGNSTYSISRDNGTTWTAATAGTPYTFDQEPSGQAMRLKASIPSGESIRAWSLWWK